MPLKPGYSYATVQANAKQMRDEGYPPKQALAAALESGRVSYFKKYPSGHLPAHLKLPGGRRDRAAWDAYRSRTQNPCGCRGNNPVARPTLDALADSLLCEYRENGEASACKMFDNFSRKFDLMRKDEDVLKRKFNELLEDRKQNPVIPYALELKLDTEKKWKRIFTAKSMPPESEIFEYIRQFALDRQTSPSFVDAKVVGENDVEYYRESDRTANKPRRPNPVPPSKVVQARNAADLYTRFTGHEAMEEVTIDKPVLPDVMLVVGDIDGVMYTTVRDGKVEKYIHQFKKKARPLFCVSHDGKQIHLIGGEYDFTERGIVDRA